VWPYQIEDRDALATSLDIDTTLAPGDSKTIGLMLAVDNVVDAVDFTTLPIDDGRLELETTNAQMPTVRAKMVESIVIDTTVE
jgi:hypothetical protein